MSEKRLTDGSYPLRGSGESPGWESVPRQPLPREREDVGVNDVLIARAVEHEDPSGVGASELQEPVPHAVVKGLGFRLEAVRSGVAASLPRALETDRDGTVENDRELGEEPLAGGRLRRAHVRERQPAAVGLIGERRFREAIAEHDLAARERGANEGRDVLRPIREDQEELRPRGDRFLAVEQELANALSRRGAAGLARGADRVPELAERAPETLDLRGLAAALDPFDREEHGSSAPERRRSGATRKRTRRARAGCRRGAAST